ncbi:MAG: Xylan 1,4-beta-xylosidase [Gemmatimonadetes bacterium]|nr:Xylan 1,4-beta-xylosidase [Gemmatimonadota bacterium]
MTGHSRADRERCFSWRENNEPAASRVVSAGEPVKEWAKPNVGRSYPVRVPQTSDEFASGTLGLQWQWHANPREAWYSLAAAPGMLRLNAVQTLTQNGNLWFVPNLLLQKFPAPSFTATTKIVFHPQLVGEKSGLVVMGRTWGFIALTKTAAGLQVGMYTGTYGRGTDATRLITSVDVSGDSCYLEVDVAEGRVSTFSYSLDGRSYRPLGDRFRRRRARGSAPRWGYSP